MADRVTFAGSSFGLPPGLRPGLTKPLAGAKAVQPQVSVGWIRLEPEDLPELSVLCELGDDVPDVEEGYGGFTTVDREGDEALTHWPGFGGMTVPVEVVLDGTDTGQPIDALYDNLEALAGRGRKRLPGRPPNLIVDTAGLMRQDASVFPDVRWVISALAWSKDADDQETDDDGHRLRAVAHVTLLKVNEATALQGRALKNRLAHQAKATTNGAKQPYTVKEGESLITVARKKLGDAGRWPELAQLNGIRDPLAVKPGARIRLP